MVSKIREDQNSFLEEVRSLIRSDYVGSGGVIGKDKPEQKAYTEIEELMKRIENLERQLEDQPKETAREGRVKDQISALLQENKKLSAGGLSKLIGLSRTRCSEYLRQLTKEGVTEGVLVGRQKFYKLVAK